MKVAVTKDHWDGTRSKTIEVDLEAVSGRDLAFMLMGRSVAGVTITKTEALRGLEIMKEEQAQKSPHEAGE